MFRFNINKTKIASQEKNRKNPWERGTLRESLDT
jgi:hypothetical protein